MRERYLPPLVVVHDALVERNFCAGSGDSIEGSAGDPEKPPKDDELEEEAKVFWGEFDWDEELWEDE